MPYAITNSCLSDERIWKIYGKMENIGTTARILWNIFHEQKGENNSVKILK
jgi:hypothetical protein